MRQAVGLPLICSQRINDPLIAGEVLAKSLLMGGVTHRFPDLRVALLEGGVVNGSRLYTDIFSRWNKRNVEALENLNPANIDAEKARELFLR